MDRIIDVINLPARSEWKSLMTRAVAETRELHDTVAAIIDDVRSRGDEALIEMAARFDGVKLNSLKVTADEIAEAVDRVPHELKNAIAVAAKNISAFHKAQRMTEISIDTMPGVRCTQKAVAIENIFPAEILHYSPRCLCSLSRHALPDVARL